MNITASLTTGENPQQGAAEPAAEPVQQTGLALEELNPEEPTAQSEGAEAPQTAECIARRNPGK